MAIIRKNVDGILKAFTKAITDLEKVQEQNDKEASSNEDRIDALRARNVVLDAESARAMAVVKKLRDIVA